MFTVDQKYKQGHRSAQLLRGRSGFADALAELYFKCDPTNALRLREAFPELLQVFPIEEDRDPQEITKAYFINQFVNYLQEQKNG
jgi:hypothetical protein